MPARRVALALPQDLYEKVYGEAERNGRSVNAELVLLIDAALGSKEPEARGATPAPRAGRCPHPRARVIKGFCYRCGKPAT